MEYEKIKQLMEDMGIYKLESIDLELSDGTKIRMKKQSEESLVNKVMPAEGEIIEKTIIEKIHTEEQINEKNNIEEKSRENQKIIKSPMVGTFYTKPSPTANPYVEVGINIKKGDVVCIVEAMKLMNEIESEFAGKIVEIFVNDGDMVEYGTPLFSVE